MFLGSSCTPAYIFRLTVVRNHLNLPVAYSWMLLLLAGACLPPFSLIPYFPNLLNWWKIIHPVLTGLQIHIPDLLYKMDDHRLKKWCWSVTCGLVSTVALELLVCQLPFSNSSERRKILMQTGKYAGWSFSRKSLLSPLQLAGNLWFVDLDGICRGNHTMYFWHNDAIWEGKIKIIDSGRKLSECWMPKQSVK